MTTNQRQQVLVLYLATSALDSNVKGWSMYDGTGKDSFTTGDASGDDAGSVSAAPYGTGLDALLDGWRVIQFPQLTPPYPGEEYSTSFMKNEFIFEKLEAM
ncbi:MAG: hypothetical protein AAF267_16955 [Deinococcota bacterium]